MGLFANSLLPSLLPSNTVLSHGTVLADFAAKKKLFYFVELCWVFNFLGWGIVFLEIGELVSAGSEVTELEKRVGFVP